MVWITASKIDDRLLLPTETKAPNVDKELPKMWQCMAWPPPTFRASAKAAKRPQWRVSEMSCALLPRRVCCPQLCAMPVQHLRFPEQAQEKASPRKINATSKSPVGDISVVTLIRTDTTLDHSQKAEKVC